MTTTMTQKRTENLKQTVPDWMASVRWMPYTKLTKESVSRNIQTLRKKKLSTGSLEDLANL